MYQPCSFFLAQQIDATFVLARGNCAKDRRLRVREEVERIRLTLLVFRVPRSVILRVSDEKHHNGDYEGNKPAGSMLAMKSFVYILLFN